MRIIGIVVRLFVLLTVVGGLAAAAVAQAMKGRLPRRAEPDADEVALVAIFEPLQFASTARAFRGGTLDCWFGGGVADLRGATLAPAGATLRVRAIFGGAQVVVPESWHVETRVVGVGGAGDARGSHDRPVGAPRLVIEGLALFGGFGVSSSAPDSPQHATAETAPALSASVKADAPAEAGANG